MKKFYFAILLVFCHLPVLRAQKVMDYSVRVSATLQKSPASITLHWPKDSSAVTGFTIYKKLKTDPTFKTLLATLAGTDTVYTDKNVTVGAYYEYEIVKTIKNGAYYGFGYIASGIEVPVTESRGKLILLYDKTFIPTLQPEITRLVLDMTEDGWTVIYQGVSDADSVTAIQGIIQGYYNADPNNVNAVFLLGHIPVPYSGGSQSFGLNPIDGHVPQHEGAWPADIYYSDMNGNWTDNTVNDTLGEYPAQHNVPGDGKFDQDIIPATVVLQVGRVDMFNLPSFAPLKETDLIRRYLNKDHSWRIGNVPMQQRGLVKDYFGTTGTGAAAESFAAAGYKNFAPMFGVKNVIDTGTWETVLSKNSFLWSYGCGPGSITNASGLSATSNFVKDSLQTVFITLFGSWFGDWNTPDNYLRAALASKGPILTDAWSGRPQWQFHHMAMGDNIGYSALINFNNYGNGPADHLNYFRSSIMGSMDRMIHVALMGDPTLRMHVVQPPGALSLSNKKLVVTLNWTASSEPGLLGYYVYRSSGLGQPFTNISTSIVTGTTFTDNNALYNKNFYMVRAVKLEQNPSGSYYNLSQGSMDTITTVLAGISMNTNEIKTVNVFPNPGKDVFHVSWPGIVNASAGNLSVSDVLGNELINSSLSDMANAHVIDVDLSGYSKGVYLIRITSGENVYLQRVVKD